MNQQDIWHATLGELQLQMTKATFDTWVRPTYAIAYENGVMTVGVHSPYAKEWLENRLHTTIQRTLTGILGCSAEIHYVVKDRNTSRNNAADIGEPLGDQRALNEQRSFSEPQNDADSNRKNAPSGAEKSHPRTKEDLPPAQAPSEFSGRVDSLLNPKYTFETFIVGKSNQLAHAAARAVADNPGGSYNPLFIYGGTGMGKTHLLHALGQIPLTHNKRVRYISSETFTNDLINSIRNQNQVEFRRYYREIDVLLIDDIQFIAGKEATQEEFFHTFNHLHSANKQIVISSDRHPRAIPTLEERVRSRFEGGLIADIQVPDLEMRIAILRTKAEAQSVPIPSEVIDMIAHNVQSNIRELEGALIRVQAYARLMNKPLTLDIANQVLEDSVRHQPITVEQVIITVAEFYRVDISDLTGPSRSKEVVLPRQMAMYLLREETGASLPQIGEMLGGRDHTTVMYAHEKMAKLVDTDNQRRRDLLAIKERLYQQAPV